MRSLILVAVLATAAHAGPRRVPDKYSQAARAAFQKGRELDDAGQLGDAVKQYQRAYEISPHAYVLYNIADLYRRMENYDTAIKYYEQYLATDAIDDRRAVEKLVKELRAIPGTLEISMEDPDAVIYVDGKRVGKQPATGKLAVKVPSGTYVVDGISPITHNDAVCSVSGGHTSSCALAGSPREDGNVVISARWPIGGKSYPIKHADGSSQRFQVRGRSQVKPGHYPDLEIDQRACKPPALDVPAGDVVLFVWATYDTVPERGRDCIDYKVTVERVKF